MNDPFEILRDQLEAAARPRPRTRTLGGRLRGGAPRGGAEGRRRGGLVLVAAASALSVLAVAAAVTTPESEQRRIADIPVASPVPDTRPAPGVSPIPDTRPAPGVSPVPDTRPVPGVSPVPDARAAPGVWPAPNARSAPGLAPAPLVSPAPAATEFELRPDLTTGHIGWCATMRGVNGCGPAASPQRGLIIGVGSYSRRGGTVAFVVSERVAAAVLPGGQRLPARSDPRVPAPLKLILAYVPNATEGRARFVDANGRDVSDEDSKGSWATSAHRLRTRERDRDAPCALSVHGDTRFRVRSTSVLTELPTGRDDVVRPSFLACATTVYYSGKTRLRAAVLLDAADPRAKAPLLPGMAGEPRGIVATGPFTSATRAGAGWIQVFGKGAALRKRLLAALTARVP
jgi:hypothetical protein